MKKASVSFRIDTPEITNTYSLIVIQGHGNGEPHTSPILTVPRTDLVNDILVSGTIECLRILSNCRQFTKQHTVDLANFILPVNTAGMAVIRHPRTMPNYIEMKKRPQEVLFKTAIFICMQNLRL